LEEFLISKIADEKTVNKHGVRQEQALRQVGVMSNSHRKDLPDAARHLWDWFLILLDIQAASEGGLLNWVPVLVPIIGLSPRPWEVRALWRLLLLWRLNKET
jgi:hypothetical protein